jgi:hypothetical protein
VRPATWVPQVAVTHASVGFDVTGAFEAENALREFCILEGKT